MTQWAIIFFHSLSLSAAAALFLLPVRHRARPIPRIALGLVGVLVLFTLWQMLLPQSVLGRFTVAYCLVTALFTLCADLSWRGRLYCGIWVLYLYGISFQLLSMVLLHQTGMAPFAPGGTAALLLLVAAIYAVVGRTIALWMPDQGEYPVGPRQLLSAYLVLAIDVVTVWQFISLRGGQSTWQRWAIFLMVELYCGTILYLQHELFRKSAIRQELAVLSQLWSQQKNQYSLAKENIALINQKCHDLKHQIQAMRLMSASGQDQDAYIREMEQSIQIYDLLAKTGNEVLDTVLTEKSLYCESRGISVHCVADGSLLSFLDPVDLYTLFGNAMDNAIEAVSHIDCPEQRIIDVLIYEERQFCVVQIINPVAQTVEFDRDGLPRSTKGDDAYHGFGLKSIRHTVKKHGGHLRLKVQDQCFYLEIVFPKEQ